MPRYEIEVRFTEERTRTIKVYAPTEDKACEKAEHIVSGWENVTDVIDADVVGEAE